MKVAIRTQVVIVIDGIEWRVNDTLIKEVNGGKFVKLPGSSCPQVVRMLYAPGDPPKGMSPAQCRGMMQLKALRNQRQQEVCGDKAAAAASSFFGSTAPKKQQSATRVAVQQIWGSPRFMELELPQPDGEEATHVHVLRPAHPTEDVWVELAEDAVQAVFMYMRKHDRDEDAATSSYCHRASHQ